MILSKACEYGIKAMICIAVKSMKGEKSSLARVARNTNSPEAFTAKTLQKLVKAGLVKSSKGAYGGFYLEQEAIEHISVWDIVRAIDGNDLKNKCMLGLEACSNTNPCPMHNHYKSVREQLMAIMQENRLRELAEKVSHGEGVLALSLN